MRSYPVPNLRRDFAVSAVLLTVAVVAVKRRVLVYRSTSSA
jgi:hypothetical protein